MANLHRLTKEPPRAAPPPGSRCAEASALSKESYIPCLAPAIAIVRHANGETYCMCDPCAFHNVKNRGGRYVGKGENYKLTPIVLDRSKAADERKPMPTTPAFIEAAASPAAATNRVAHMAQLMRNARLRVDAATAELKAATDLYNAIEMEDFPELMKELGISGMTLDDGTKVDLIEDVKCAISIDRRDDAHSWVRARGDGGIIKTKLMQEFGRDESEAAERAAAELQRITNRPVDVSESIHHSTLKAYVKERLEEGVTVPADLFGLHVFNRAKLTASKRK